MLAEIAELEKNTIEKQNQLQQFINLTDNEGYKTMYAKYLAHIYAEDIDQPEKKSRHCRAGN